MPPSASIIIPTRSRPDYLEVALAAVAPQAAGAGAELVVVDDGRLERNAQLAERFGARYVSLGEPRGLNAARNAGIEAATGELLAFIDDDVEVHEGWLEALITAAHSQPDVGVFTGPIVARFEGTQRRVCGREGPPITHTNYGDRDRDVPRAWGANLTIRRSALDRVGTFDPHRRVWSGDEEEWEQRHLRAGGRIRYIAAAGLDHRRVAADATPRALMAVAMARGREARAYDEAQGRAPTLERELRVLTGCLWHTLRRRCDNGPVMAAHSLGRIARARQTRHDRVRGDDAADFLSGESGTVGGRRDALRELKDRAAATRGAWQLLRARRAARGLARRVLVLSVVRERHRALYDDAVAELRRSACEVVALERPPGELEKFANLNLLLEGVELEGFDWILLMDDDVRLPAGFLAPFLHLAERYGLRLAAPAHRLRSHAAWRLTRRQWGAVARETAFVEIGPLTALHRDTYAALLPFPAVGMGWGLDAHWSWLAREHGWRIGLIDLLPVAHLAAPAASAYAREEAIAAARAFLAEHPYLPVRESQRTLAVHRRCA
ncbi:MAG TPA: glycosyltransferase family A protein [Solirubrobacteraceae bacterium]|nr:glycosyltransferase family A protein [Solirubrobacteraceae bacterium]